MPEQLSYEEWTERLCRHFFRPEHANQPVTFFVDDELLGELSGTGDPQAGVASLCLAVKDSLGDEAAGQTFEPTLRQSVLWKITGESGCPPALPLLAVSVLAASHMAAGDGVAAHNYYHRFRELLDLPGEGRPGGYEAAIPDLWDHVRWWLHERHDGALGRTTVRPHPFYTYIGYALSQTLFRESDRHRLSHFFQWLEIAPAEEVSAEELAAYYRVWAPGRAGLSAGAQRLVEPEYEELLRDIVETAFQAWDGSLRDTFGRRKGRILVTLSLSPFPEVGLVAQRPGGFPSQATFRTTSGEEVSVGSTVDGWYDHFPLRPTAEVLESGLQLVSGNWVLELKPSAVIPLRQNPELGRWSSVRQVAPLERHWVLVRESSRGDVEWFLRGYGRAGWAQYPRNPHPLSGWSLFRDMFIDSAPTGYVPASLERLIPAVRRRPALFGGLPMPGGQSTYLLGGEPDLWVPPGTEEAEETAVSIDGEIETSVPAQGARITLRELGLDEGLHEIKVGPSLLAFRTLRTTGTSSPAGTASRAWIFVRSEDRFGLADWAAAEWDGDLRSGEARVAGSLIAGRADDLPSSPRPPVLLPYHGREYVLLGSRPGEIEWTSPPRWPAWLVNSGLNPAQFDVHPAFDVVWIAIRWTRSHWQVRMKAERQPDTRAPGLQDEEARAWADALVRIPLPAEHTAEAELWREYVEAAAEIPR